MTEIGYEEDGYTFTGGDAGDDANWEPSGDFTYSPPGDQADPGEWQWNADDIAEEFEPGVTAPIEYAEFSSPTPGAPDEEQQQAAVEESIRDALGITPEQRAVWDSVAANPDSEAARTAGRAGKGIESTIFDNQGDRPLWDPNSGQSLADYARSVGVNPMEGETWSAPGTPETRTIAERSVTGRNDPATDKPTLRYVGINGQGKQVDADQARTELRAAGYPQWETATDQNILDAYARTVSGAGAPKVPGKNSTAADFQKYVDAVVKSNRERYDAERSDKEAEKKRMDRDQKIKIITQLLSQATGPGGPKNLRLALALLGALDNLTTAESAILAAASPPAVRRTVAAVA